MDEQVNRQDVLNLLNKATTAFMHLANQEKRFAMKQIDLDNCTSAIKAVENVGRLEALASQLNHLRGQISAIYLMGETN